MLKVIKNLNLIGANVYLNNTINKLKNRNYYLVLLNIFLSSFLLLEIYLYRSINLYIIFVSIVTIMYTFNKPKNINVMFINSLILFITLRLIFFVGTDFKILPFIDNYWEVAVVRTFIDNGKIFVIPNYKGTTPLEGYSSWPMLHIYEYTGMLFSNIDPITLHIFNLLIINSLPFVLTYIIIRYIYIKMNLPKEFVYIALIACATLPDVLYLSHKLVRNTFGWIFILMIIFIIIRYNHNRPSHIAALSILSIGIVLSHHLSSLMLFMLLFSTYLLINIKKSSNRIIHKILRPTFILIIVIILIIWWLYSANIIFTIMDYNRLLDKGFTLNTNRWTPQFPPELTPPILKQILFIKTFIIYVPFILGGFLIYKLIRLHNKEFVSFIFILYIVSILLILFNLFTDLEPTRAIAMLIPFLIISLAIFYLQIYKRYKYTMYILISFLISTSFIGIFSHSIVPLHLYTNIVNPLDIGEHSNSFSSNNYIKNIDLTNINNIFSDDPEVLAILVDTSHLYKIEKLSPQLLTDNFFHPDNKRVIIITKEFFTYKYAAGGLSRISYKDALEFKVILKQKMINTNLIYSNSYSFIYQ